MKTVIVTGASGNMGKAIVKKFLDRNYLVVGTLAPQEKPPADMMDLRLEYRNLDLLDEPAVTEFVNTVVNKYNSIDIAVLTVGGFSVGNIESTSTQDVGQQIRLNFDTAYNMARPIFAQMMKQKQGRIFLTGSRPGLHAYHSTGMVAYSLGKSLLFRLADLMNEEARGLDLVTNIIVPSTIDTPQNRKSMPDADHDQWIKPEEIANIIYYHCSPEAASLRETVIKVYGNS